MTIPPTLSNLLAPLSQSLSSAATGQGVALPLGGVPQPDSVGFSGVLGQMINESRQRDITAQQAVESFARNEDPGRIHETMLALSKAEISLRTLTSVRNKLIDAYHELLHVTA